MQRCTHLTYRGHKYTESPNKQTRNFSRSSKLVLSSDRDVGGKCVKLVRNRPSRGGGLGYQGVAEGWHFPQGTCGSSFTPRPSSLLVRRENSRRYEQRRRETRKKGKGLVKRERVGKESKKKEWRRKEEKERARKKNLS